MDGRRLTFCILAASLALGTLGCRNKQTIPQSANDAVPAAFAPQQQSSGFLGMGSSKKFPGPPPEHLVVRPERKKGQGVKIETEIAWADLQVEAAIAEGRTAVERDRLLDDARQRYHKALTTDPKNKAAYLGLARLYEKAGDFTRSSQMYREAIKLAPQEHAIAYNFSKMLARAEDWSGSVKACEMALQHDPENRTYQKTLGYCMARANQWDDAFGSMLKVMPEADARYFLGRVLMDVSRPEDAKQQFHMALAVDRTHEAASQILAEMVPAAKPGTVIEDPNPVLRTQYQER